MSTYTDHNGLVWTRSEDRLCVTCSDGRIVYGNEQMTDEYMVSFAYLPANEPIKTDAERIAELEAQLAALLSKLST